MSRFWNPTHMIKVGSCHQLIPWTWRIVTTEGLGPGQAIFRILRKPHLTDSYSRYFENLNKNLSFASQTKCDKMLSYPIRSQIIYFYILLFSYVPGLYIFSFSYVVIIHLLRKWEGVEIYCRLISDRIESTRAWISFPAQYRTKFEIRLREVFQYNQNYKLGIWIWSQARTYLNSQNKFYDVLTLDHTRLFPTPIYQTTYSEYILHLVSPLHPYQHLLSQFLQRRWPTYPS